MEVDGIIQLAVNKCRYNGMETIILVEWLNQGNGADSEKMD